MRTQLLNALRAVVVAGALVVLPGGAGSQAPSSALLAGADGALAGDTVRISGTADGQLFMRLLGATGAMLLIDPAAGTDFVASVRAYIGKARAGAECAADDAAIPRLVAAHAHRSGIDGIALRCDRRSGSVQFAVLATRKSDGPALEPLSLVAAGEAVESFARDLERVIAGRRR